MPPRPLASDTGWIPVHNGYITAAGAPSRQRLEHWADCGVTDVATLQRSDELRPWLPEVCADLGLTWHHIPLSGRRLERKSDRDSLVRIPELAALLTGEPPRAIVVHCAAGLHRTGVCLYLIMRAAGHPSDEAIELIRQARPLTAEELVRKTRRGILADQAEALHARSKLGQ